MRYSIAVLLVMPGAVPAVAADAPAEKLPVAVFNSRKAIFDTSTAKEVNDKIRAYAEKKEPELIAKQGEVAKLRQELKDKESTLKPDEKKALEDKLAAKEADFNRVLTDARRFVERLRSSAMEQLEKEAERILKEYAKERGIQVIIDTSGEQAPKLAFVNPSADITAEIAKRLEKFKIEPVAADPDPAEIKKDPKPQVVLETTMGDIVLELDREKAPVTVANFIKYAESKHYDGTVFHRVIKDFMIQGGGHTADLTEKETGKPIVNEATNGLKNVRGSIAMARTNDPDSATAQFFINVVDNAKLDHQGEERFGYAVFGKVVKGMDVVDKIREVKTGDKGTHKDVPLEPITIKSAKRLPKPAEK